MADIQIYGLEEDSIVDGPGMRFGVFVQGCTHHCPGCHNPDSQPFNGGYATTTEAIIEKIKNNKLTQGVTISGGEPFDQPEPVLDLATQLEGLGYDLWIYSGYLYEDLLSGVHPLARKILEKCHVLVDGPFIEAQHSYDLHWKGSRNQRVIDLPASLAQNKIVFWHDEELDFKVPLSW